MEIVFHANPDPEAVAFLERNLLSYNHTQCPNYAYEEFIIQAYDDMGQEDVAADKTQMPVGGIHGQISGGWLYIAKLWVCEKHRGGGLGKKLLFHAEETARTKTCAGAYLYTFDFQSPAFYEKQGYAVFGALEGEDDRPTRFFMKKKLHPCATPRAATGV